MGLTGRSVGGWQMVNQVTDLVPDSGALEHPSLYYKCLTIGRLWVHTISVSGNGNWSPSQTGNGECPPAEVDDSAISELWDGIKLSETDKYEQLGELLSGIEFRPSTSHHPLAFKVHPEVVTVWWS